MTSAEGNGVDIIRAAYELVNRGDIAALEKLFSPGMVRHDLADFVDERSGGAAVTGFLEKLRAAMPDLRMQLEDVFESADGRVAARSTLTGTHTGSEFFGASPSGATATFAAITLYRIEDGRIAEAWSLVDWAGALRQLRGSA